MPSFMSEKLSQSRHLLSEDNYDFIDAERILLADLGRVLKKLDEANQEDLDLVHDLRSRIPRRTSLLTLPCFAIDSRAQ